MWGYRLIFAVRNLSEDYSPFPLLCDGQEKPVRAKKPAKILIKSELTIISKEKNI